MRHAWSGGEQRRLRMACALVSQPSIIFLDEPTSGGYAVNQQSWQQPSYASSAVCMYETVVRATARFRSICL